MLYQKNKQKPIKNQLKKYNPEGNFPKVLLLNPKGEVLGILGYEKISPEAYIEKLKSFVK